MLATTRVLAGLRVIEQGSFITGPYAAMLLADLGAEVIKVERPGGDPFRSFEQGLYGPQFQAFNRGKRSIALDLAKDSERAVLQRLIETADVYIHNFRPGVVERLGVGPEQARRLNPRLVYCAITGFGRDGPYAQRPAYDTVAQGLSGFLSLFVAPERPRVAGPALADSVTGLYAALGVLGALVQRGTTGEGRLVEVSMLEAISHFAIEPFQHYFATGVPPGPADRGRISQSFALVCADRRLIALHLSSPAKFWDGLLAASGRPDLARDPRFSTRMARVRHHEELAAALGEIFATRPRAEWLERLAAADVPHAPVLGLDEALADPQMRHLGIEQKMVHPSEGVVRTIRSPVVYDGERNDAGLSAPPTLDEHGDEIRRELAGPDHEEG